MTITSTARATSPTVDAGVLATVLVGVLLVAFALSVDYPRAAHSFKGDEATYYSLTYSLARDADFAYTRDDLIRVWDEFPAGPEGIFLKRGRRVGFRASDTFPWIRVTAPYDMRPDRLYYGKAFIYPFVAAPFVKVFGTNGFLVLHALLLTTCFGAAIAWQRSRGSSPLLAIAYAAAFLGASVVPLYFVWLTPELFNFAVVLLAYFVWSYKEGDRAPSEGALGRMLRSPASDYVAAMLLGVATFAKLTHIFLIGPLVVLAWARKQWGRGATMLAVFGGVAVALFAVTWLVTGEANYQGGDRRTFYGSTGFPFANARETFDTAGQARATDAVPLDILISRDTATVFGHNLVYFIAGRYSGFVPYFFPGVVSLALFLSAPRRRPLWQWLTAATAVLSAVALLLYMPYTYSGGGGSIGNRYYLAFYALFLFLTPTLTSPVGPLTAMGIGALFTASLVLDPFDMSFDPGAHAKAGPLRVLPIELTELNDLPVSAQVNRSRLRIAGTPPLMAYLPDDNVYDREGEWFWIRGRSRADIILRAPAVDDEWGTGRPLRLEQLSVQLENGPKANHVTVATAAQRERVDLMPGEKRDLVFRPGGGVPYRPMTFPTNYLYTVSVGSESAFVPFLEMPGSSDSRLLGVRVRFAPLYAPPVRK